MAYSYAAGTTTPTFAGLVEFNGIRLNDGTFHTDHVPPITDSPPLRSPVQSLASDDGGYAGTPYYDPWPFEITGWLSTASADDVHAALDQLKAAFNLSNRDLQILTVNSRGWAAARQMSVRLNGQIISTEPSLEAKKVPMRVFTIPLIAPDPLLYSTGTHTVTVALGGAGTVTNITNAGTMDTPFTARFTGPMTAPQLVYGISAAPQIYFGSSYTIAAGDWVEVTTNPAQGQISAVDSGGNNVYGDIGDTFNVFTVPAGTSGWFVNATGTTGASSVTMTFRDAWA